MTRYIGILIILLTTLLWSCSDNDLSEPDGGGEGELRVEVEAFLELNVTLPEGAAPASRSDDDNLTPGISYTYDYRNHPIDENDVQTLTMFCVNVDEQGEEVWSTGAKSSIKVRDARYSYDSATGRYHLNVTMSIKTDKGLKHIYLGANMTTELERQFFLNQGVYATDHAMNYDDYSRVNRQFVIHGDNDEVGSMAMFCTEYAEVEIGQDEVDGNGSEEAPYQRSAELERMVAKILFTCDASDVSSSDSDNTFVAVKARIESEYATDFSGWMRLNSVRFKLGTTNRTTYYVKHTDSQGNVIDPNYYIADQLANDVEQFTTDTYGNPVSTGYGWGYANEDYRDDFTYFNSEEDMAFVPYYDSYLGDLTVDQYNYEVATCMPAELFDASRVPSLVNTSATNDNLYTTGMYCLENTTDNNWSIFGDTYLNERSNWFLGPRMVATNLMVETQYIPAVILDEDCLELSYDSNGKANAVKKTPYMFSDDAAALAKALANGNCRNGMEIEGLSGTAEERARQFLAMHSTNDKPTYYAYRDNTAFHFYTESGAERYVELARQIEGSYVSSINALYYYANGLGYYHGYLNQLSSSPSASSQTLLDVVRNNYYIIRCTFFNIPATIDNGLQMITYQTTWRDWVYSGKYSTEDEHLFPE